MGIKYLKPRLSQGSLKCTVHSSGRLGYTLSAAEYLGLQVGKYVKLGINEENVSDTSLYMVLVDNSDEESFKIYKAGKYFYLKTKDIFSDLNLDFRNKKIIYDISDIIFEGKKMYKLNRRMKDRKKLH